VGLAAAGCDRSMRASPQRNGSISTTPAPPYGRSDDPFPGGAGDQPGNGS
jgi:hypothetical protein